MSHIIIVVQNRVLLVCLLRLFSRRRKEFIRHVASAILHGQLLAGLGVATTLLSCDYPANRAMRPKMRTWRTLFSGKTFEKHWIHAPIEQEARKQQQFSRGAWHITQGPSDRTLPFHQRLILSPLFSMYPFNDHRFLQHWNFF